MLLGLLSDFSGNTNSPHVCLIKLQKPGNDERVSLAALCSRLFFFFCYSSSLTKLEGKSNQAGNCHYYFFCVCCSVTQQLFFAWRHTPSNLCSRHKFKWLIKEGDILRRCFRASGDCLFCHETLSVEAHRYF